MKRVENQATKTAEDIIIAAIQEEHKKSGSTTSNDEIRELLQSGSLNDRFVEVSIADNASASFRFFNPQSNSGMNEMEDSVKDFFSNIMPKKTKKRRMKVIEALNTLKTEEAASAIDNESVERQSLQRAEQMGIILLRKGLYDESRAEFAEVLRIKPDYAEAHKYIGFCYNHEQNLEQALSAFLKACEVDPSDPMSHELVAVIAEKVGKTDLALAHWDNILALDPANKKALERRALLLDPEPHD